MNFHSQGRVQDTVSLHHLLGFGAPRVESRVWASGQEPSDALGPQCGEDKNNSRDRTVTPGLLFRTQPQPVCTVLATEFVAHTQ